MKIYGYIRVSSIDQNTDRQFSAMQKLQIPKVQLFTDKQSGQNFERDAYRAMVKRLKPGDLLYIGATLDADKTPKIFNVNWFRKDDGGGFLWPGFGDNMRVLDWIIDRCEGKVDADETAIGFVPKAQDINLTGIEDEVSPTRLAELLSVDRSLWQQEIAGIEEFYATFGEKLPSVLAHELAKLKKNIQ